MTEFDFERSFGYVLFECARLMGKRFDQRARPFGLTRAQSAVLVHLFKNEGINQAGLADLLELEPISLARCLDRMEQAGWVERRPDPGDRRARLLYLTAKAKPVLDQVLEIAVATRAEALAGIAQSDRDRAVDLLHQVRRNLTERGGSERATQAAGAK